MFGSTSIWPCDIANQGKERIYKLQVDAQRCAHYTFWITDYSLQLVRLQQLSEKSKDD